MNYEYEIQNLKTQVKNLQDTVIQMAMNRTPEVAAREATTNDLIATDNTVEQNTADIDYIMMMEDL